MKAQENKFFAFNLVCYIFLCFISYRLLAVGYRELVWLQVVSFGRSCLLMVAGCRLHSVECRL
jgi:hypothetical protein